MGRPRIPLSTYEREQLRKSTLFTAGILLLGLAIAGFAATRGDTRVVVLVLVTAGMFFAGIQLTRLRKPWLSGLVLAGAPVVSGALLGYPGTGAVAGIAFFAYLAVATSRLQLDPDKVQPLESIAVDPEAAGHVAAFEQLGFEQAAALSFEPGPGKTWIETLMTGPRGDEYAAITELVVNINSTFGSRLLVTRNVASASLVPEALGNDLRGADVVELVAAHERALEILATRGLRPDPIDPKRLLESHIAFERRSIEWALDGFGRRLAQTLLRSGTGFGPLDESPRSQRRIDDWLAAPVT